MTTEQLADRPLRSVFVGNIPYEVTEEKLKEIFSEVGPVLSLKLVFDRETGKPKGYGFCEYKDVETAMSAMRNLNGYEINGRILRVDNAGAERTRMAEMSGAGGQSHNGPRHEADGFHGMVVQEGPPPPEKAPEVVSRAVASLPPEQMFDLMKQMKLCIQNNPNEARTMLLQNPQLAYALLQALVVMKIVDPPTALAMLHKDNQLSVGSLLPEGQMNMMGTGFAQPPPTENPWIAAGAIASGPVMPLNPPGPFGQSGAPGPVPDTDMRKMDPRLRNAAPTTSGTSDFEVRDPRSQMQPERMFRESMDPRTNRDRDMRSDPRLESRSGDRDMRERESRSGGDPRLQSSSSTSGDPRTRRGTASSIATSSAAISESSATSAVSKMFSGNMAGLGPGATDSEKAVLIMQVLQLSDEQIAMLPPEQRQSILVLKEQIARSTSGNR